MFTCPYCRIELILFHSFVVHLSKEHEVAMANPKDVDAVILLGSDLATGFDYTIFSERLDETEPKE